MASLYKDMASLLVDAQYGDCRIEHFTIWLKPKSESPDRFNTCWAEWYAKTGRRLV